MSYNLKKNKLILYNIIKFILLIFAFVLFIGPFVILVINSFKTNNEILESPINLPKTLNFENYTEAFEKMKFLSGFLNSLLITVISVVIIVFFSSMAAYLFVRKNWKVNRYIFLIMVASMIIPFQSIMIPLVKIYGDLELLNNQFTLIFMYIGFGASLAIFIFHGFIKSIPIELEEAALLDGCTVLQTYFKIVFPLLKPTTITILLLDILWIWNDFLLPNLVLLEADKRTLPLSTFYFFGAYTVDYNLLLAGLMMSILPVLIVYLFMQKQIIHGIVQGAIK
ncbi:MAG: carbohydrate ABC transporter permease [Clostridiales bacterium]